MSQPERNDEGGVDAAGVARAVRRLVEGERPRFARLWTYYRNPMRVCAAAGRVDGQGSERPYRQGQEWGMPSRVTGLRSGGEVGAGQPVDGVARKEVVVENDIGWRVDTMVELLADYGHPKPPPPKPQRKPKTPQRPKPYPLKPRRGRRTIPLRGVLYKNVNRSGQPASTVTSLICPVRRTIS